MTVLLKLYVLLYADDTVILAETPDDLQKALYAMEDYCTEFKLHININKTKIMKLSRGKLRNIPTFYFGKQELEVVDSYPYLGLHFNYNGKFNVAKKKLYEKATRAMFSVMKRIRTLQLPIDMQLKLFVSMVKPIILYGAEIWGDGNNDLLEKIQLKLHKYIFKLNKSTCSAMIYGELGEMPLSIDIKTRVMLFWANILLSDKNKLSAIFYKLVLKLHKENTFTSSWIAFIRDNLNNTVFSGLWINQELSGNIHWFKAVITQRLKDQFKQTWSSSTFTSNKCENYRMFKTEFGFEKYLIILPEKYRIHVVLSKCRCRNYKLPIETGCSHDISQRERFCTKCNLRDKSDEFHYIFNCKFFDKERK